MSLPTVAVFLEQTAIKSILASSNGKLKAWNFSGMLLHLPVSPIYFIYYNTDDLVISCMKA